MDPQIKKQTLRLLNYGLYVVTAAEGNNVAAGSVDDDAFPRAVLYPGRSAKAPRRH